MRARIPIHGAAFAVLFLGFLPGTSRAQADVNEQILAELRDLKARVSTLESKLQTVTAEASQAKAEAAQARSEAVSARAKLAPGSSGSPSTYSAAPSGAASGKGPAVFDDLDGVDAMYLEDDDRFDGWWTRTSLGGYGELHLTLGDTQEIDFHRWVLYLNHEFNDRTRFVSELELEHSIAGDGQNGEIELEQAYLEYDFTGDTAGRAGVILIPAGIINEIHEPTTFFGVERNPVEREIIPTTWWEGGAGLTHRTDSGWQWDGMVHSGLNVPSTGGNAFRIRSGRQKVSEAEAYAPAATTRLKYTGIPGLEVAATAQWQGDITQSSAGGSSAWMGTGHIDYRKGGFGLRALGGAWNLNGSLPAAMGLDQQWGAYVEPSYRFELFGGVMGVFGRFNQVEAAAGDFRQYDAGLAFWPIENIVFKLDYSRIAPFSGGGEDQDLFNIGFGYVF